ncbi:MAG: hypothetical protein ACR2QF_09535, partial [Geminicoccaceae bacterium]
MPLDEIGRTSLTDNDMNRVAESILEEARRRKGRRVVLDSKWKEIDRQVEMEPRQKLDVSGRTLEAAEWMANLELPLQADTLEVLIADTRRLMFPTERSFFAANCILDDDNLERLRGKNDLIAGLDTGLQELLTGLGKAEIDQDFVNEINAAALRHFHRMYRVRDVWDLLNGEAFKYGTFIARARRVDLTRFANDTDGVRRVKRKIPVLIPRSVKDVFLDDTEHSVRNQGLMVEPSVIEWTWHRLPDLQKAARAGSSDPTDENGGWIKRNIVNEEPFQKSDNLVQLIEFEGDAQVVRSEGSDIFLPNMMLTVMVSRGGPRIIRMREREFAFRSYIIGHYQRSDILSAYATSPLMVGSPIHKAATEALNRVLEVAALNAGPPGQWDPSDSYLQASGGPVLEPKALWEAIGDIKFHQIGDASVMLQIYLALLQQYSDATGTSAPRLGAQTKSHQTAFAVDSEQTRGLVRTVDYARSTMIGPTAQWLWMEHEMAKKSLRSDTVYLDRFQAYVNL